MACSCGKNKGKERFTVTLPGGLKITKGSEAEAKTFAAAHPGSKVSKAAT